MIEISHYIVRAKLAKGRVHEHKIKDIRDACRRARRLSEMYGVAHVRAIPVGSALPAGSIQYRNGCQFRRQGRMTSQDKFRPAPANTGTGATKGERRPSWVASGARAAP